METYGKMTGQEINCEKSALTFSHNTPDTIKKIIAQCLGIPLEKGLGKYLGVPTEWSRSKKEVFSVLVSRMEKLCQAWKGLALSQAGKETMLKSVFQGYPTYIMSCFLLPKGTTKKMNSRLNAFFWGGDMEKKAIPWRKGSVLTAPKQEGGMGFKDFHQFNMALLVKQGWKILNGKEETWIKLLKGLYFPYGDFMEAEKGRRIPIGTDSSDDDWVWHF
ncbi:unnamed protein product [Linum trigynum]|uniref:Reverse transcriptase n=1 Tax=Linum trigynum TaxID=586398 RepID=A0AAV2F0E5_9ROSI